MNLPVFPADQIDRDIEDAKDWAAPSKLFCLPGQGEGWRHNCFRLACEVQRLRAELSKT